jgi:hypothetical protein
VEHKITEEKVSNTTYIISGLLRALFLFLIIYKGLSILELYVKYSLFYKDETAEKVECVRDFFESEKW